MKLRQLLMLSFFSALIAGADNSRAKKPRLLAAETLEPRQMLAAAGLVDIGAQPSGALDGKVVYVHGGHGITPSSGGGWGYQRPLLLGMVEDHGNQDQMSIFADELWRSGATVVPLRPVGHQVNEVILDNDDVEVTFTGAWSDSSAGVYFGDAGDVPYRFASTSATETATAQYRPNMTEAGFYPVYAWTRAGTDRASDQMYRVHHAGGATEVTINHRMVGNGLVYLGSYYFEEGTDGYVEISNQSSDSGRVVIADMIRFGNGMGDITSGNGTVSGESRENETALLWLQWHTDRSQGVSSSTHGTSTVSAPTRYATYMNQASEGSLSDRVFVSFHSNAGGGGARGVLGLHNTSSGGATPNQFLLAETLAKQVNDDLSDRDGEFERDWSDRGSNLTYQASFNYGEINNSIINNEFDATIVETGFHDNQFDAEMLRDRAVREAIAKATVQGLIDYFHEVDGVTADVDPPAQVAGLTGESAAAGEVTLSWAAGGVSNAEGAAATGYMVYASTNGLAFDGGRYVAGGATTTHTLTGLTPGQTYYFRVAAVNEAGEAVGSEVVAVKPSASGEKVLIVNGFDRDGRALAEQEQFRSGSDVSNRVRLYGGNTRDYAIEVANAIDTAGSTASIATASNEAVGSGAVDLSDYDAVIWISGTESSADSSFDASEQAALTSYLAQGGKLFSSGAEIAWDLDALGNGQAFYNNTLHADYVADDAGTYNAAGEAGSIFEGVTLTFDSGEQAYDVAFPDVISALGGATPALGYGGGAGSAALQFTGGAGEQLVVMGFPFESILGEEDRTDVMARVLDYFGFSTNPVQTVSLILDNDDGSPTYTEVGAWGSLAAAEGDTGTQRFVLRTAPATATWTGQLPVTGDAEVFVYYEAGANRASGVKYTVTVGGETRNVTVNQQENGLTWVSLGTFDNASGAFTITVDAENSTGSSASLVVADRARVDVRGVATPANGDFNDDGVVNAADYTVWRDTLNQTVTPYTGADADGNGVIDHDDHAIWASTYGQVVAQPTVALAKTGAPVSEPVASEPPVTLPYVALLQENATSADAHRKPSVVENHSAASERDDALLLLASLGRNGSAAPTSADPVTLGREGDFSGEDADEAFADAIETTHDGEVAERLL